MPSDGLQTRTISLNTAYGQVVACEEVPPAEFPSALRRIYRRALECTNAVVILDGVTQSRNAFLDMVRHFNDTAARAAQLQGS